MNANCFYHGFFISIILAIQVRIIGSYAGIIGRIMSIKEGKNFA